jgi:signal transduction histidine kinase
MNSDDRRRALISDTALAVGMLVLSIGSVLVWEPGIESGTTPLDAVGYLLIGAQTLPLIWRRRFPVAVLAVIVVGFMIDRAVNYPSSWAFFGTAFAVFTVGSQLPPKRSLLVGTLAIDVVLGWTLIGVFVQDVPPFTLATELAVLGFPLLVGRESYFRQQQNVELETRTIQAEHRREQEAADAVTRERVRIARELHDVVAHEITVMTIQSAAARRVLTSDPAQAEAAIESAEEAGHRALTEIRRLLGMLRTADPRVTDPQPGLGSLDHLVEQMNDAGLSTKLSLTGDVRPLPLGVDVNAYRIIQESLTNTLKHGGPDAKAEIKLDFDRESLTIEVADNGRGAASGRSESPGQGLVGMYERAALLDGALRAGPRPGGGYRVNARIPIPGS